MRCSTLFGRTLREAPADADLASHQLLMRAGMIRPMAAGIYSYLPLGLRVVQRIAAIIRAELDAIGGQELLMPIAQPAELWKATGRYQASAPGPALVRWQDRNAREMVLAMTHEEAVTALARSEIRSHRQLPLLVYQIQTKFRDEPRPRGGLIRTREFLMQDGYSFHADAASLDATYHQVYAAYLRIMARCGLDVLPVVAATGMMGGARSHEFVFPSDVGEDTVLHCPRCGYAANAEAAQVAKGRHDDSPPAPIERVATPDTTTIEALARLLGIAARQTLKAVLFSTPEGEIILAVIRGDLAINEAKLSSLLGDQALAPATAAQLGASGLVAGYASPVGLRGMRVVADDSVGLGGSFVAGANEAGYHLRNVSYPRDFAAERMADIALA
ncbi:MAG: proline--tRNA ligase, partial [Chloroflexota bacterium]